MGVSTPIATSARRRAPSASSGTTSSAAPTAPTCRCGASCAAGSAERAAPVLDVGAGTGRVALDLARRGPRA